MIQHHEAGWLVMVFNQLPKAPLAGSSVILQKSKLRGIKTWF